VLSLTHRKTKKRLQKLEKETEIKDTEGCKEKKMKEKRTYTVQIHGLQRIFENSII
jgi:hypothetical protein